jgi:hypothetical protein
MTTTVTQTAPTTTVSVITQVVRNPSFETPGPIGNYFVPWIVDQTLSTSVQVINFAPDAYDGSNYV